MGGFLEALPFYLDLITTISCLRQGLGWGSSQGCWDAFAYFCANCGKRENSENVRKSFPPSQKKKKWFHSFVFYVMIKPQQWVRHTKKRFARKSYSTKIINGQTQWDKRGTIKIVWKKGKFPIVRKSSWRSKTHPNDSRAVLCIIIQYLIKYVISQ